MMFPYDPFKECPKPLLAMTDLTYAEFEQLLPQSSPDVSQKHIALSRYGFPREYPDSVQTFQP